MVVFDPGGFPPPRCECQAAPARRFFFFFSSPPFSCMQLIHFMFLCFVPKKRLTSSKVEVGAAGLASAKFLMKVRWSNPLLSDFFEVARRGPVHALVLLFSKKKKKKRDKDLGDATRMGVYSPLRGCVDALSHLKKSAWVALPRSVPHLPRCLRALF